MSNIESDTVTVLEPGREMIVPKEIYSLMRDIWMHSIMIGAQMSYYEIYETLPERLQEQVTFIICEE